MERRMMRARGGARVLAIAALACASLAMPARAQNAKAAKGADTTVAMTYDDAAEIAYLFNSVAGLRNTGATTLAEGDSVVGNLAVLWGPLTVAGTVHGSVIVINGSVTIAPTGHIDKDVIVTGGSVTGADSAHVGGVVQEHHDALRFHQAGELIIAESPEGTEIPDASWFKHWLRRHVRTRNGFVIEGGPYNRVEGLPISLGPSIRQNTGIGVLRLSALGTYRSADNFAWKGDNLGWNANAELTVGGVRNIRFGIAGYDAVRPTETWQMRDAEVSLASFFLRQDYRDYYNTKGAHAWVRANDGRKLSLELGVRNERWEPRDARDPFTLFKEGVDWRPNPTFDDGRLWIGEAAFKLDTRNNVRDPWTGWLIDATFEVGGTDRLTLGPTTFLARDAAPGTTERVRYTRLLADITRYNRVSPQSQLNFRLVFGAGFNGDALPLERRFALGGAGTLPGYDFRNSAHSEDVLTCDGGPHPVAGIPAQCDHMLLGQVEYRHDSRVRLFGRTDKDGAQRYRIDRDLAIVGFADAGRGWLTGPSFGELRYPSTSFPSLNTFKYDVGTGIDLHYVGFYVAKSLTDWSNSAKFIVRLRHRF
jgi:hypothetical protein